MHRLAIAALLCAAATPAAGQSSQFGVQGVGLPGRLLSARASGSGGAFALFDAQSGRNPASLLALDGQTASVTSLQNWRNSENPAGSGSAHTQLFPLFSVGGLVPRRGLAWSVGLGNYADREFAFSSSDTLPIGGSELVVFDTTVSKGGLSDLRIALGYQLRPDLAVGGAFHVISGSNRLRVRRAFADSTFDTVGDDAELAYDGFGVDLGVVARLTPSLRVAGSIRYDGSVDLAVDSVEVAELNLPLWMAGAVEWAPRASLLLAGEVAWRGWGAGAGDYAGLGGTGAQDTWSLAAGGEFYRDPERPTRLPLRLGVHWTQLPFPLVAGQQGREWGLSVGTGTRFGRERGGVDLALQRVWRQEGSAYREGAWLLTVGVSVRP